LTPKVDFGEGEEEVSPVHEEKAGRVWVDDSLDWYDEVEELLWNEFRQYTKHVSKKPTNL